MEKRLTDSTRSSGGVVTELLSRRYRSTRVERELKAEQS